MLWKKRCWHKYMERWNISGWVRKRRRKRHTGSKGGGSEKTWETVQRQFSSLQPDSQKNVRISS